MQEHIAKFLATTGLLHGRIPSLKRARRWDTYGFRAVVWHGIALVHAPAHAVCLSIAKTPGYVGGVSIGTPRGLASLPDVLVGFLDEFGRWHWPGDHGTAVNLHVAEGKFPSGLRCWPVWFTFGNYHGERELLIKGSPSVDLSGHIAALERARFWEASKHEFIQKTWAPSRLSWCLDTEDLEAFLP